MSRFLWRYLVFSALDDSLQSMETRGENCLHSKRGTIELFFSCLLTKKGSLSVALAQAALEFTG